GSGSVLLAVLAVVLIARSIGRLRAANSVDGAPLTASSATPAAPARPPRCSDVAEPFVIGDANPQKPPAPADAGAEQEDDIEELSPFAVEIGRGVAYGGGFGASVLRDAEGGTAAFIATLGADGHGGKVVRLGRSRGDLDAPVIAAAGDALLAAMIEPHA